MRVINENQSDNNPNGDREMTLEEARRNLALTPEEIAEMGGEAGNLGYPDLTRYGLMAREYLKEAYPARYQLHLMNGDLMDVLLETEREANALMETLQTRLRKENPPPKPGDFLAKLQYETMIRDIAEEIVIAEVVHEIR